MYCRGATWVRFPFHLLSPMQTTSHTERCDITSGSWQPPLFATWHQIDNTSPALLSRLPIPTFKKTIGSVGLSAWVDDSNSVPLSPEALMNQSPWYVVLCQWICCELYGSQPQSFLRDKQNSEYPDYNCNGFLQTVIDVVAPSCKCVTIRVKMYLSLWL